MAKCSICGSPSGLVSTHPTCEVRVQMGETPEQIQEAKRADGLRSVDHELAESARRLPNLGGFIFPVFVILGGAGLPVLLGVKDDEFYLFCIGFGALAGGLVAWVLWTWMNLHASLALRIARHLDERQ